MRYTNEGGRVLSISGDEGFTVVDKCGGETKVSIVNDDGELSLVNERGVKVRIAYKNVGGLWMYNVTPRNEGRLSLVDDYGVKVTVNELRPKAYAGHSKRDAAYWLASVTVTRPNGYKADGWVLYSTDEGGAIWMRCTTSEMTYAKSDRAVNTTLMDALWLAWMRAYRVHPSGQSKARQIQQEADRAYELRRQHRRDEEARRHDDK